MRQASEADYFPFEDSTMCYFTVDKKGKVVHYPHKNKSDKLELLNAIGDAKKGEIQMYAVWPGRYRSDLFLVDNLEAFTEEFNFF